MLWFKIQKLIYNSSTIKHNVDKKKLKKYLYLLKLNANYIFKKANRYIKDLKYWVIVANRIILDVYILIIKLVSTYNIISILLWQAKNELVETIIWYLCRGWFEIFKYTIYSAVFHQ